MAAHLEPEQMTRRPDVLIIGAGVMGLSAGIRLAEEGLGVRVYAAESRASAAAGAIWDPLYAYHPSTPEWAARTYDQFFHMAGEHIPGVRLVHGLEASRTTSRAPDLTRGLPDFRECTPAELPDGFATGWQFTAPIVDMPVYLDYLEKRLRDAGGEIETRRLRSLDEGVAEAAVLVNCSGMGARELVPDRAMQPVKGQLVAVRNPGVTDFFIEQSDGIRESTYFLPHGDILLLGGSAEPGNEGLEPDAVVAQGIVERCSRILPAIGKVDILGHRVGIRPHRPQVRLEHVVVPGGHVVHNYGHSGSGVSLSWGCADDALDMVIDILR
jgi:D-amino-acid oxidase